MSDTVHDEQFLSRRVTSVLLLVLTTVLAAGFVANGNGVPGGFTDLAELVLVGALFAPPFVLLVAVADRRGSTD